MGVITEITVTCAEQEDYTGTDDLNFSINGAFIGTMPISSGETKVAVGPGRLLGDTMWGDVGMVLKIEEFDALDANDVLLEHTITQSDYDEGCITLSDQVSSAKYTFKICFLEI